MCVYMSVSVSACVRAFVCVCVHVPACVMRACVCISTCLTVQYKLRVYHSIRLCACVCLSALLLFPVFIFYFFTGHTRKHSRSRTIMNMKNILNLRVSCRGELKEPLGNKRWQWALLNEPNLQLGLQHTSTFVVIP